jgi:hypothetical protein
MSTPWPPPPDLASIQDLVRAADPEGFLKAPGAPQDEYDPEERALLAALPSTTADLITANILPPLEEIWQRSFSLGDDELSQRRPALLALAKEIERFFGPDSKPRTRAQILADGQPQ